VLYLRFPLVRINGDSSYLTYCRIYTSPSIDTGSMLPQLDDGVIIFASTCHQITHYCTRL